MLKQPIYPDYPYAPMYQERTIKRYIYSYTEPLSGRYQDPFDKEQEITGREIEGINLDWLIEKIPQGIHQTKSR